MANLKGSSFEKQVKDIHHRTSAFGESRHGKSDHQTHSSALADKRAEISKSFANYATEKGFQGKLNEHMTNSNIQEFLNDRTANMATSTAENYIRAFSSLIEGLKESNVDIQADKSVFNNLVHEINANSVTTIETGRAIDNIDTKIDNLYNNRYESGVIADTQRELGLRVAEARELVSNPDKYINNNQVNNLIGKGNHVYEQKEISVELQAKIKECENIPSKSTYLRDLKEININRSHDFRYTFVKENRDTMTKEELSKELNHKREDMTNRYIARL